MKHRTPRIVTSLAAVAAALTLTACGGGGGDSPDPVDLLLAPRVVRLKKIIERSDTFSIAAVHFDYSVSIGNADAIANRLSNNASCTRASCDVEAEDGGMETTAVQDLIDLSVNVDTTEISLGSRGGFDTIAIASEFDVSGLILDDTATFTPPIATAFGVWGEHGFAGIVIGNGSLTGEARQTVVGVQTTVPFEGRISYALAYVMGNTTGRNPSGVGVATWEGIAEAASLRTFERRQGTATLVIADLSDPRLSVDIDVDGFAINSSDWANLPLTNGSFTFPPSGTVADGNYLAGNFHGSGHEEAYGVFDTEAYTGAFGAKRDN